jgi:RNA polymerase sigma factor (sigma-70 family)
MSLHAEDVTFPFVVESDGACEYVRHIGLRHARTLSLHEEDCEDCALGLVVHLYRQRVASRSWLNTCARRYALNYLRHYDRLHAHEVSLTEAVVHVAADRSASQPLKRVCRLESLAELAEALGRLKSTDQEYLVRTYYADQSPLQIAAHQHKGRHAAEQGLSRARRRLAVALLPASLTVEDFHLE